jgi:hypothetical protein
VPLRSVLVYAWAFWQWAVATELADPLAPVDTPGLVNEKGGFAPCGLSAWLAKAGWPTACVLAEHSSPGTSGSLTAKTGELATPTNSAVVAATASILLALLNATSFCSSFPFTAKRCIRIVGRDGSM